jgi:hypothetical protein
VANEVVEEMNILRHMLGIDRRVKPKDWGYRNYFNAEPGHNDYPILLRLEKKGLIERGPRHMWYATPDGCEAVGLKELPK